MNSPIRAPKTNGSRESLLARNNSSLVVFQTAEEISARCGHRSDEDGAIVAVDRVFSRQISRIAIPVSRAISMAVLRYVQAFLATIAFASGRLPVTLRRRSHDASEWRAAGDCIRKEGAQPAQSQISVLVPI